MSWKNIIIPQSMSENNFDQLPMGTQPKLLPNKKDFAAELRKAVILLMCQCLSEEHGNNVDFHC